MKQASRLCAVILALALLLGLSACGGTDPEAENDPGLGTHKLDDPAGAEIKADASPEPWGEPCTAGGITVTFPFEWEASDRTRTGPWAAIYEKGEYLGALYVQSSTPADPATAAGYLGETFPRSCGGREFFCAFRGSSLDEEAGYSLDLYSGFSSERCLDVRLSLGNATQEELLAFAERPIFADVLASIETDPSAFADLNKGVDTSGFERDNDGVLTAYTGGEMRVVIPSIIADMPITGISKSAFRGNETLVSVTLPETLTWIDDYAFADCRELQTVDFNDGLMFIGAYAFQNCISLRDVLLPTSVTTVDEYCFDSASVGGSFVALGGVRFGRCAMRDTGFDTVRLGAGCDLSEPNIFSGAWSDSIELEGVSGRIGDACFNSTKFLREIVIPEGVTALGEDCFLGSSIELISLPESLEEIGSGCFSFTSLQYLVIPAGVRHIAGNAISVYTLVLMGSDLELDEGAISTMDLLLPEVYSPEDIAFPIDPSHVYVWHHVLIAMDASPDETIACDEFLLGSGQEDLTWFGVDPSLLHYDIRDYETSRWTVEAYHGDGGDLCVPLTVPYAEDNVSGILTCELIADGCYKGTGVTSLTFTGSIYGIGSRILEDCEALTDLWFNAHVLLYSGDSFAADAFEGIPAGVTVHLPASLTDEERGEAETILRELGLPADAVFDYYSFR